MAHWDSEPTTSELRAPRPEDCQPVRHRRRKNTKQWCRGKVGVEHKRAIRLRRSVNSWLAPHQVTGRDAYWPHNGDTCGWSWWLWRLYDDWSYRCGHESYCTNCGKIFDLPRVDCPDYANHPKPTIDAREAEDIAWARRRADRRAAAAATLKRTR